MSPMQRFVWLLDLLQMRYNEIENYKPTVFKRLTGVKRPTFEEMVCIVDCHNAAVRKHKSRGRPSKLCTPDKLLMLLMYYREYRTFLHISVCYGISEMHCWRVITIMEQILLQSKTFHLPGKKALHATGTQQPPSKKVGWNTSGKALFKTPDGGENKSKSRIWVSSFLSSPSWYLTYLLIISSSTPTVVTK